MKVAGIVAEYNPFHNGHAHQIERTRAADNGCGATHVVAVMSGHFVQRGEPALLPKADRVKAALRGGVDLVLELPVPWCLSSAEGFAFGAVSLLDALGCVDVLSFGSECGDLQALEQAVDVLASPRFADLLAYHLEGGLPFPEARQKAAAELRGGVAALFESPNNTLGIEYIKALRRLTSGIVPFTVRRFGAGHDARLPAGDMASATFLRSLIEADRLLNATAYMPAPCAAVLAEAAQEGRCPAAVSRLERALLARLRTMSPAEFASLPALSEGLENRLASAARQAGSYQELLDAVKTRRYPLTRIRRLVWSAFLGLSASLAWDAAAGRWKKPPYLRVLGANDRGLEILRAVKNPALPLLARPTHIDRLDADARAVLDAECRAADLYALALPQPPPCGGEFTAGLIRP